MLWVEENHAGASTSTHIDNRMLYTEVLESGEAASAEEITRCSAVEEEPAYER